MSTAPIALGLDKVALRRGVAIRFRRRPLSLDVVSVGMLLALVAAVTFAGMTSHAVHSDEGTYVAQGWALYEHGTLSHYTYWYDHPPFGWMQLAAWFGLTGALDWAPNAIDAGRLFVALQNLVSTALVWLIARRLGLRRPAALLAAGVFALNPLGLALHSSVLLDNLAMPWLLGAFALALDRERNLWSFAGAALCFSAALLTRETLVLMLPALAVLVWRRTDPATRRYCVTAFFAFLVAAGAVYPLYAIIKGELIPGDGVSLADAIAFQLFERPGSGSVFDGGTEAGGVVAGWLATDPWLLVAAALAVPLVVRSRALLGVALAFAVPVLMALRPGGYLPASYILSVLPFAALLVGAAADVLWPGTSVEGVSTTETLRGPKWWARLLAVDLAIVAVGVMALHWPAAWVDEVTRVPNRPQNEAVAWLAATYQPSTPVLVDETIWLDLVVAGFDRSSVYSFTKVDTDPAVIEAWNARPATLAIVDPALRGSLEANPGRFPTAEGITTEAEVIASFGPPGGAVEVWRLSAGGPA